MSDIKNNPLDELFKNKLGEREFEFDQAAWAEAEVLIDSANSGSAFYLWKYASISGGILGAILLLLWTCNPKDAALTSVQIPINDRSAAVIEQAPAETLTSKLVSDENNEFSNTSGQTFGNTASAAPLQEQVRETEKSEIFRSASPTSGSLPGEHGSRSELSLNASAKKDNANKTKAPIQKSKATGAYLNVGTAVNSRKVPNMERTNQLSSATGLNPYAEHTVETQEAWMIDAEAHFLKRRTPSLSRGIEATPNEGNQVTPSKVSNPLYLEMNVFTNQWKTNAYGNPEAEAFRMNSLSKRGYGADFSLMVPKGKFSIGGGLGIEHLNSKIQAPAYSEYSTSFQDIEVVSTDSLWTPTSNSTGYYFNIYYTDTIQDTVTTVKPIEATCTKVQRTTAYASFLAAYHYRKNRWMLTVSAGPTLRYLLEQRGNYPSAYSEAYAALENSSFRTFNIGALIRPSVHYQLSDVLSMGASLSYHNALLNSGDNDLLVNERLSSLGVGLSFRYFIH